MRIMKKNLTQKSKTMGMRVLLTALLCCILLLIVSGCARLSSAETAPPVAARPNGPAETLDTFSGQILCKEKDGGERPVSGAMISLHNSDVAVDTWTDINGFYSGSAEPGDYTLIISAENCQPLSLQVTIPAGGTLDMEPIFLLPAWDPEAGALLCTVCDADTGALLSGAKIWAIPGWSLPDNLSNEAAQASLPEAESGKYVCSAQQAGYITVLVSCSGYSGASVQTIVLPGETNCLTIQLTHIHLWNPANYQAPATCSVCGKTDGEPLMPDFEKYQISAQMRLGQEYMLETRTNSDNGTRTVAHIKVTDYKIIDSDENHVFQSGYQWRIATFQLTFSDYNAQYYGSTIYDFPLDYYDYQLTFGSMNVEYNTDDTLNTTYMVLYNGEADICTVAKETVQSGWQEGVLYIKFIVSAHVPIGYDGAVYGFCDSAVALEELGEKQFYELYKPTQFLFFRFN